MFAILGGLWQIGGLLSEGVNVCKAWGRGRDEYGGKSCAVTREIIFQDGIECGSK